jgi:transglutaminase-like putative cysteine protease
MRGFAYHMWNEAWIDDRWVPLDATLGLGGIGAGHLKILTSDFAGATPYGALLPVLDVLGKLKIEIVSIE